MRNKVYKILKNYGFIDEIQKENIFKDLKVNIDYLKDFEPKELYLNKKVDSLTRDNK